MVKVHVPSVRKLKRDFIHRLIDVGPIFERSEFIPLRLSRIQIGEALSRPNFRPHHDFEGNLSVVTNLDYVSVSACSGCDSHANIASSSHGFKWWFGHVDVVSVVWSERLRS
jgi:hypothetical protein